MNDPIERQAAIDAVEHITSSMSVCVNTDECYGMKRMQRRAVIELTNLPSVQPERKKGKWNFIGDQMFECTECGTCYTQGQFHQMRVRITDSEFPKFCPNCGADMR